MVRGIPKTLAIDRASLAGAGICVRLYSIDTYSEMPEIMVPEIKRSDLTSMVLLLASLGIHVHDIGAKKFVNQPPIRLLDHGLAVLEALGAIDFEGKVTPVGKLMAKFLPLNPMTAKCMLVSEVHRCSTEIATIFAMIESKVLIKNKGEEPGDHIYLMNLYNSWDSDGRSLAWCKQHSVRMQLMFRAQKMKERLESAMQQIVTFFHIFDIRLVFKNVAKLEKPGRYVTIKDKQIVEIAESSVLYKQARPPRFLVYHKHGRDKEVEVVTEIKEEWLSVADTGFSISG
ncbi:pre-mRNA-splicing factor ATP-dependent RNA helicase DEAH1-like protein [Tanacetum coccineum]